MKYLFFLLTILTAISCSKSEPQVDDKDQNVNVEMTFYTGTHNSYGSYTVNNKDGGGFSNVNPSKTIKETFKVGDEIYMNLNRFSLGGTGRFGMLLMVNNRLVRSAESGSSLKLEINYKITEEDTKQ